MVSGLVDGVKAWVSIVFVQGRRLPTLPNQLDGKIYSQQVSILNHPPHNGLASLLQTRTKPPLVLPLHRIRLIGNMKLNLPTSLIYQV